MRRVVYMLALCLVPACRHDLTICHDESDGPACRDTAPAESADEARDADPSDALADSTAFDTDSIEDSSGTDADSPEVNVDSTVSDSASETSTDTLVADTPDTYAPDTFVADTYAPDTFVADTYAPDTFVADTYAPDTFVADTYVADTAPSCTAGSYSCGGTTGNNLLRCGDSGYSLVVSCPAGTCSASLGRCTACTPGGYLCDGAVRKQCDSFGATSVAVATCATAELCAASTGASCAPPVCVAGAVTCSAGAMDPELGSWATTTCNTGRTGYFDTVCPVTCSSGACLTITSIAGGGERMCILLNNGTEVCWGVGASPGLVTGLSNIVQIAVGQSGWAGARLADGTVRTWSDIRGAGAGDPMIPGAGTAVAGVAGAQDLAIGDYHACFRVSGGTVKCWGMNANGQLTGTGDVVPPSFATIAGVVATGPLAAGFMNSFAIVADGARGWGRNDMGQLGTGSTGDRTVATGAFAGAVSVAPGETFSCALTASGNVLCAGANDEGQLGDGSSTSSRATPALVLGLDGLVTQIAAGQKHACALLKDSTVRCWGRNFLGQLGDASNTARNYPVAVSGLSGVAQIAAGGEATCALLTDAKTVKCWGAGWALGFGASDSNVPKTMAFH